MRYAIVGFGNIGKALAKAFARKGIEVSVATTRDPESFASAEIAHNRDVAERPGTVAAIIGIDPQSWRVTRVLLSEHEPTALHLARALLDSLPSAGREADVAIRVVYDRLPHEFSGGQRQRIGLARALALKPDVLVADESVSALDVTVQAQVLKLLEELKGRLNLAMLFITHDLHVAAQVCDRIAVMRQGEIVEIRPATDLIKDPQHPYTRELLSAIPGQALH